MSDEASCIAGFGPVNAEGLKARVLAAGDVVFGRGGETELRLDLYRPAGADAPLPAVIFIHGGGWCGGEKADYREMAARVAAHGYLCASINYRLSHQAPFPAAVEDCKCAVRWLRAHAAECGADAECIGALGASAGAHLAAMVALTPGRFEGEGGWPDRSSAVQCAACYCGPFDLTADSTPILVQVVGQFVVASGSEDLAAVRRQASPIHHVAPGAPPFLLVHGDRDEAVPIEQSEQFCARLGAAGVAVEFIRVRNGGHGHDPAAAPNAQPDSAAVLTRLLGFLGAHLQGAA
jgi:acetyl esterase/lipase